MKLASSRNAAFTLLFTGFAALLVTGLQMTFFRMLCYDLSEQQKEFTYAALSAALLFGLAYTAAGTACLIPSVRERITKIDFRFLQVIMNVDLLIMLIFVILGGSKPEVDGLYMMLLIFCTLNSFMIRWK